MSKKQVHKIHLHIHLQKSNQTHVILVSCRPDLIEFHKLTRSNATHNLQQAFNVAEQHLGLTKLLDPEGENV